MYKGGDWEVGQEPRVEGGESCVSCSSDWMESGLSVPGEHHLSSSLPLPERLALVWVPRAHLSHLVALITQIQFRDHLE